MSNPDSNAGLDLYTWTARVTPVFLILLPLAVAMGLWFPTENVVVQLSTTIGAPALLAILFGQLGRDMGRRRQPLLWASWGGSPTTQLLRHRSTSGNASLREHYRHRLGCLNPSLKLPTVEMEARAPHEADQAYEVAVRWLISRTRDRARFPLIYKENTNYGFRRNVWGMRPGGIVTAVAGLLASILALVDGPASGLQPLAGCGINLALVLGWIFVFTPAWVRTPAEAYAERLLEACNQLEDEGK